MCVCVLSSRLTRPLALIEYARTIHSLAYRSANGTFNRRNDHLVNTSAEEIFATIDVVFLIKNFLKTFRRYILLVIECVGSKVNTETQNNNC